MKSHNQISSKKTFFAIICGLPSPETKTDHITYNTFFGSTSWFCPLWKDYEKLRGKKKVEKKEVFETLKYCEVTWKLEDKRKKGNDLDWISKERKNLVGPAATIILQQQNESK